MHHRRPAPKWNRRVWKYGKIKTKVNVNVWNITSIRMQCKKDRRDDLLKTLIWQNLYRHTCCVFYYVCVCSLLVYLHARASIFYKNYSLGFFLEYVWRHAVKGIFFFFLDTNHYLLREKNCRKNNQLCFHNTCTPRVNWLNRVF